MAGQAPMQWRLAAVIWVAVLTAAYLILPVLE
jgi:hypothetical protein